MVLNKGFGGFGGFEIRFLVHIWPPAYNITSTELLHMYVVLVITLTTFGRLASQVVRRD